MGQASLEQPTRGVGQAIRWRRRRGGRHARGGGAAGVSRGSGEDYGRGTREARLGTVGQEAGLPRHLAPLHQLVQS